MGAAVNDPNTDIAAWLESRRVTVGPVDEGALVGIGHAQTHLRSLLGRIRCETLLGVLPPPVRSTLLYGPPGTGKTALSRWFASQLDGVPAYDLPAEQLTPGIIRAAFAHLATRPRSIVFLAEVDAVGIDRRESDPEARRALYALLEALDGLVSVPAGQGPVVVATTNRELYELDRALTRPGGRIGTSVRFGLPTLKERAMLYRLMAQPWTGEPEPDWRRLAELSARWSPADIRGAVDDAVGLALLRDGAGAMLRDADLVAAVRRANRIEPEDETPLAELPQVASHEAGHVACAVALGRTVRTVQLGTGHRGGQTQTGEEEAVATAEDLWAGAVSALGGIAAEELLYGNANATVGGESDVRKATDMLIARIETGLDPAFPPISRRSWGGGWTPLAVDDMVVPRVVAELAAARAEARRIVEREQDGIRRFAAVLLERQVLSGSALADALDAVGWVVQTAVPVGGTSELAAPGRNPSPRRSGRPPERRPIDGLTVVMARRTAWRRAHPERARRRDEVPGRRRPGALPMRRRGGQGIRRRLRPGARRLALSAVLERRSGVPSPGRRLPALPTRQLDYSPPTDGRTGSLLDCHSFWTKPRRACGGGSSGVCVDSGS